MTIAFGSLSHWNVVRKKKMHGYICHRSPARHNLPVACDRPTMLVSRGSRSDRAPVQLHIEPLFTYDYICNQYSEKWHQWQVNNNGTPRLPHSSSLDAITVVNVDETSMDTGRDRSSSSQCISPKTSQSKSLFTRFIRSLIPKTVRNKSVECV